MTFFSLSYPKHCETRPPLPHAVHARRVIVRDNLDHPSFLHAVTATSMETRQGAVSRCSRRMNGPRLEEKEEKKRRDERKRKKAGEKGKKKEISVPIPPANFRDYD